MLIYAKKVLPKANNIFCSSLRQKHRGHKYVQSYVASSSNVHLLHETIGQRLEYASENFDSREAFVYTPTNERLNFKQLKRQAEELAAGLLAIGLKKGDRVGLWATNSMEWILTQYGTALSGIIQVNINPAYKTHELEYSLKKVGCKAIIMSEKFKTQNFPEMLNEVVPELAESAAGNIKSKRLPELKSAILISDKKSKGFFTFNEIMSAGDSTHYKELERVKNLCQFSDPINIQYTSGTTGSPKGVMLSHHMILNNAYQAALAQEYDKHDTRLCLPLPLYHCFGMVLGSLATVTAGITCILPCPVFNSEDALKAIHNEKCTTVYGTPTMFIDMFNQPNFHKYDMSSLNAAIMSGSTCPVEVVKETIEKMHTKNIVVLYGMTETSPVICLNHKNDSLENRTQFIGQALGHTEIKVVDSEGRIVPVNQPGELLVRGHNTMLGYWGEKEKTDETYTADRFLKTGDVVRMNEYGYFTHESRLKDVVIRGGENIYPREVEEFLHQHPKIADVYVIGLPDRRMGEELCACIKLKTNAHLTADELKNYCKDKIAHFKIPRYVEFMHSLPMTVTGKIQKNRLREIVSKKHGLK